MKKQLSLIVTATLFMGINACSTGQKISCTEKTANQLGFADGKKGLTENEGLNVQKYCKEKGVEISLADYKSGWIQGIQKYCSPKKAFALGKQSKESNLENCPVELKRTFEKNYARGEQYSSLSKDIKNYEDDIADLKNRKVELQKAIAKISETNEELEIVSKKIDEIELKKERISKTVKKMNTEGALNYIILD